MTRARRWATAGKNPQGGRASPRSLFLAGVPARGVRVGHFSAGSPQPLRKGGRSAVTEGCTLGPMAQARFYLLAFGSFGGPNEVVQTQW